MTSISFSQKTLNTAIDYGYITTPPDYHRSSSQVGRTKHRFTWSEPREDKTGIILSIVLFAFSFVVGLVYTFRSLYEAIQFGKEHENAMIEIRELRPTKPIPGSEHFELEGTHENREIYALTARIWKNMRNERIMACVSQSLMTVGAGILTATLITAFLINTSFPYLRYMAYVGSGCMGSGVLLYTFKKITCHFNNLQAKSIELAIKISN